MRRCSDPVVGSLTRVSLDWSDGPVAREPGPLPLAHEPSESTGVEH